MFRGVRVALSTGCHRVRGIGRAWAKRQRESGLLLFVASTAGVGRYTMPPACNDDGRMVALLGELNGPTHMVKADSQEAGPRPTDAELAPLAAMMHAQQKKEHSPKSVRRRRRLDKKRGAVQRAMESLGQPDREPTTVSPTASLPTEAATKHNHKTSKKQANALAAFARLMKQQSARVRSHQAQQGEHPETRRRRRQKPPV